MSEAPKTKGKGKGKGKKKSDKKGGADGEEKKEGAEEAGDEEHQLEEDFNVLGGGAKPMTLVNPTVYDQPVPLPAHPLTKAEKEENELVRLWRVCIEEIQITNYGKMCSPFVKFTVGGNFFITIKRNAAGKMMRIPKGTAGEPVYTEVLNDLDNAP